MNKALTALSEVEEPEMYDDEIEEEPQPEVVKKPSKKSEMAKEKFAKVAERPEVLRVEQLPDDDLIEVRVLKDHSHTVGSNTYEYKAMEATTVPKNVAEILKESGLLYEGGIVMHLGKKNKEKVVLPNVGSWGEDDSDA
jgi:hypothetical protein